VKVVLPALQTGVAGCREVPAGWARVNDAENQFLSVIQIAITPVILISGIGALMLTLTNRLGRIVDRTRALAGQMRGASGPERTHLETQLAIMWRRTRLQRWAVTLAGTSMLISCLLVLVIFVDALLGRRFGVELVVIFVASVLCLVSALSMFVRDIWVSLQALELEVERATSSR
jgi:hypothetical protein